MCSAGEADASVCERVARVLDALVKRVQVIYMRVCVCVCVCVLCVARALLACSMRSSRKVLSLLSISLYMSRLCSLCMCCCRDSILSRSVCERVRDDALVEHISLFALCMYLFTLY